MKYRFLPTLLLSAFSLVSIAAVSRAQTAPGTPLPPSQMTSTTSQSSVVAPTPTPAPDFNRKDGGVKKPAFMPGKGELEMREKLETLANLSPQQLDAELQKWPRYQQMDLGERAKLLQRIQEFKDRRHKAAEGKARELNLKLTPEQFQAFERKFWEKRNLADRQLWQEMEPRRKALDQQINNELKAEYSVYIAPSAPAPPKPAPTGSMAPATSATSGTMP